ncbi:MAG: hypothetical protein JNJ61_05905 [Anaerolineae bacterium]|nr:hypothetical protein [Anaerolineae bacterium]
MTNLLQQLDRKAGRWLNTLDDQLQQPTTQILTGAVFTHGTSSNGHTVAEQTAAQPRKRASGAADAHDSQVACPPQLSKATI